MKEILCINGGNVLSGEIEIGGAKNSLVAIIPAAIITKSIVKLTNVKPIDDTYNLMRILNYLNVSTLYDGRDCLYIDARKVKNMKLDIKEVENLRASYYFMGALLSLYNRVSVRGPGGCDFGERPIDLHLYAFNCLGIRSEVEGTLYNFFKENDFDKEINFAKKSVGATVNAILASCKIKGIVVLNNCSLEPEIDDLIEFLNKCGCNIRRDDSRIVISGVNKLHGCEYKVVSDRIEAGTFMIVGALLGNNLKINNVCVEHVNNVIEVLKEIGVKIVAKGNQVIVSKGESYKNIDLVVEPYPGFPTDLQQPVTVLLSKCNGTSTIKETIYPGRVSHIDSLNSMNASISVEGPLILINGKRELVGADVSGKDLRGGISLVMAGLVAKGESRIDGVKYIKRGYSDLVNKLKRIGADIRIERIETDEK